MHVYEPWASGKPKELVQGVAARVINPLNTASGQGWVSLTQPQYASSPTSGAGPPRGLWDLGAHRQLFFTMESGGGVEACELVAGSRRLQGYALQFPSCFCLCLMVCFPDSAAHSHEESIYRNLWKGQGKLKSLVPWSQVSKTQRSHRIVVLSRISAST